MHRSFLFTALPCLLLTMPDTPSHFVTCTNLSVILRASVTFSRNSCGLTLKTRWNKGAHGASSHLPCCCVRSLSHWTNSHRFTPQNKYKWTSKPSIIYFFMGWNVQLNSGFLLKWCKKYLCWPPLLHNLSNHGMAHLHVGEISSKDGKEILHNKAMHRNFSAFPHLLERIFNLTLFWINTGSTKCPIKQA